MASVASQLIEEVTIHAQSDSLEDVREICADGTYFPNILLICLRAKLIFMDKMITNSLLPIRKILFFLPILTLSQCHLVAAAERWLGPLRPLCL